ncbi:hypothetical protein B0H34DRAFT_783744 [Crassisporium funariophilum]|nr:hypothetical protein B0H34DRAFT_783744 [Crassisporium funariophilum]
MAELCASRIFPPLDGTVTLPETVDFHRKHNPYETAFLFHEDGSQAITKITYLEFGRACDRVAHIVRPGRGGTDGQVVAFVALSDTLLYQAVQPFSMSPRNPAAAIVKLLNDTSCHRLITTRETLQPLINDIQTELSSSQPSFTLSIEEVPLLSDIFPKLGCERLEDPFEPYPSAAVRPSMNDLLLYLHSSGSTGFPKSIPHTYKAMLHWAHFPPITDIRDYQPLLIMGGMALPAFHTLGIIVQLLSPLYAMTPVSIYPPKATAPNALPVIPTPDNILDHLRRTGSNSLVIIPALLQLWAQDKKAVELLASLEFVGYSGGSMPSKLGNFMTDSGVLITPVYGATEFGSPTRFFRRKGDEKEWDYLAFDEKANIRWVPQGDGTYESQFLTCDTHQVSVENLSDVRGYASSDLWVPHPTKPYFWKIVGRKDDVIIHSSGEKTVPAPMEDIIMSNPYVMGTLIFGREHVQAGVLIELKPQFAIDVDNEQELARLRNTLWPIVEEANKVAPAFSRIFKEMILIASAKRPLPRAGKGTVMRKAALRDYHDDIEGIYAKVAATAKVESVIPPPSWTFENIKQWLQAQLIDIHGGREFSTSGDLFQQGMDSLSATILRRRIVGALQLPSTQKAAHHISQVMVYNHPTIDKLAAFLVGLVADPDNFVSTASKTDAIEAMIAKYTVGLPQPLFSSNKLSTCTGAILITGSTGNLGAQLLEALLQDPRVETIYTLNRPSPVSGSSTVLGRHVERFADKGLDVKLLSSAKLVFLEGDASQKNLGLRQEVYDELRNTINLIIHTAWKLDFNFSLSSFEPNVQGTRNLIDLALSSVHSSSIKFLFTSSVTSAYSWDQSRGPYPEEVCMDPQYAVGNGYGESKYVAERILLQSGLQAVSFRIGQICGGFPNGAWAVTDWVPMLVKSSFGLQALPSATGVSSWLPMHAVSQSILDVAWSNTTTTPALNLVHPTPVAWNTLISSVNDAIVQVGVLPSKLPIVDFQTWFSLLEARSVNATEKDLRDIPGIKILEFFRSMATVDAVLHKQGHHGVELGGLASFSTAKAQSISATMKTLPIIGGPEALLWVQYWQRVGMFN